LNARIASTGCSSNILLLGSNQSSLGFGRRRLWLWRKSLGCAIDNLSVLDETLDHPVVLTLAGNAILDTILAEIEVTIITSAAVIMFVGDSRFAVVAVNGEDTDGRGRGETGVVANSILTFVVHTSELSEPSITGSGATGDRDLAG
jgi:hypothetical protein